MALGMPVFRLFGWSPGSALPDGVRLVHVDVDPDEIGRSHRPEVGMVADPAAVIEGLLHRLGPQDAPTGERHDRVAAALLTARVNEHAAMAARATGGEVITGAALSRAMGEAIADDDLVVDEGITATRDLRVALGDRAPGSVLWHRGSALGWGLPAAVGASLAQPSRRVVCAQGDGSLMFGVQALWTAAHHRARLAMVVADNSGYEILRAGMEGLTGRPEGGWPGLAVTDPDLDIAAICRGFGASAEHVGDPDHLDAAMADLLRRADDGPAVLVARVEGRTPPVGGPLDGIPG
jgi:benzoylformate decarboxylase